MRNITSLAVSAFFNDYQFSLDNTKVMTVDGETRLLLHHSCIAKKPVGPAKSIEITTAGWNTQTTRERLNGLPGVSTYTKNHQLYLNGIAWNGDWKTVS